MCGGNEENFNEIKPMLLHFSINAVWMGEAGSG
jgi:3-hydroxyisobutyrate dehydrogenase-like beta-hydroxyacid dehydrogenase